jgi:hypothetical protein
MQFGPLLQLLEDRLIRKYDLESTFEERKITLAPEQEKQITLSGQESVTSVTSVTAEPGSNQDVSGAQEVVEAANGAQNEPVTLVTPVTLSEVTQGTLDTKTKDESTLDPRQKPSSENVYTPIQGQDGQNSPIQRLDSESKREINIKFQKETELFFSSISEELPERLIGMMVYSLVSDVDGETMLNHPADLESAAQTTTNLQKKAETFFFSSTSEFPPWVRHGNKFRHISVTALPPWPTVGFHPWHP